MIEPAGLQLSALSRAIECDVKPRTGGRATIRQTSSNNSASLNSPTILILIHEILRIHTACSMKIGCSHGLHFRSEMGRVALRLAYAGQHWQPTRTARFANGTNCKSRVPPDSDLL